MAKLLHCRRRGKQILLTNYIFCLSLTPCFPRYAWSSCFLCIESFTSIPRQRIHKLIQLLQLAQNLGFLGNEQLSLFGSDVALYCSSNLYTQREEVCFSDYIVMEQERDKWNKEFLLEQGRWGTIQKSLVSRHQMLPSKTSKDFLLRS